MFYTVTMLKNKKTFLGIFILSIFTPLAFASAGPAPTNFAELLGVFVELLTIVIPLLITMAVVIFLYGISVYMSKSGDVSAREESKRYMVWGVVGLFVMVSVWGLVAVIDNTFFGGSDNSSDNDTDNSWPVTGVVGDIGGDI